MRDSILKVYVKLQNFTSSEQGQDLTEYALLLTMISLALTSSMGGIARAVNHAFGNISSSLA